jgi:structural maintenance of chromosome 3 (chondroitin sulfate proteoglycan 6)
LQQSGIRNEKKEIDTSHSKLLRSRAKLESTVKHLEDKVLHDSSNQERLVKELAALESQITKKRTELDDKVLPEYENDKTALESVSQSLMGKRRRIEALYAKQGRSSQFKTVGERDEFLQTEIKQVKQTRSTKEKGKKELEKSIKELQKSTEKDEKKIAEESEQLETTKRQIEETNEKSNTVKAQKAEYIEKRKEEWRRENEIDEKLKLLQDALVKAEGDLRKSTPRHVARGLEAIRTIKKSGKIAGIHGALIDCFDASDEAFNTAIEVAAGNQLFHVVVDTDATAAKLMQKLEQGRLGRLTFLPLSKLRPNDPSIPKSENYYPLLSRLKYDSKFDKAMRQVFGRKVLARSMDVASEVATTHGVDCVTLDGDEVNRRGGLHGGFVDPRRSRLSAKQRVRKAEEELEKVTETAKEVKANAQEHDLAVTRLMGEIQKLDATRGNARSTQGALSSSMRKAKANQKEAVTALAQKRAAVEAVGKSMEELALKLSAAEDEIGSELLASLSSANKKELKNLEAAVEKLATDEKKKSAKYEKMRSRKNALETLLNTNLLRQQEEKQSQLGSAAGGDGAMDIDERIEELEHKRVELKDAVAQVDESVARLAELQGRIDECQSEVRTHCGELDELKTKDASAAEELEESSKKMEKLLNKRSLSLQKREDNIRKIRELGTIPSSQLNNFKQLALKQLMSKLSQANEQLKKYAHVNKKALDQFVNFSEQRETLIKRRQEVESGATSITECVEVLDRRKDEAILRTFKGVALHFKEVFKELVPHGSGRLIMTNTDADAGPAAKKKVESFAGVQVKVSFTGDGDAVLMQQLSGGQKALVAMALIFAIQRADPAPFYLFDEIDQALDSSHRASVAALIHRQAHAAENQAQFITSTFRPEMVNVADKHYGIGHQNKVSNIHEMSKDETLDFIAGRLCNTRKRNVVWQYRKIFMHIKYLA